MKIAIQGHPTRGKEVIQILESLGGVNSCSLKGNSTTSHYYINYDSNNTISCHNFKYVNEHCKTYTLEEFEKEFPFKIGDEIIIIGLPDYPKVITKMTWMDNEIFYTFGDSTWYNTGTLRKLEMKEERNIKLTLDKAKEWYNKGGELKEVALQAFSEKELTKIDLPKTWEEFCKNYPIKEGECYLYSRDMIQQVFYSGDRNYKNWIPSRKSAEAHLAMIQLEQMITYMEKQRECGILKLFTQRTPKSILNTLTSISVCASLMMKNTISSLLGVCTGFYHYCQQRFHVNMKIVLVCI